MVRELKWFMDQVQSEALILLDREYGEIHRNAAAKSMGKIDIGLHSQIPIPGRPRLCLIRIPCDPPTAHYEYLLNKTASGLALFSMDTLTGASKTLIKSDRYVDLMKVPAEELEEDGMRALGRRIALCDRLVLDPLVEQAIESRSSIETDFRIVHEDKHLWRFCNATFTSGVNDGEVLMSIEIRDSAEAVKERKIAEQALATSASLACLMDQLFDVQFYVDETLRIVTGTNSPHVVDFFGGKVPNSLHDVLADADSANRLVKYFASRPVLCRKTAQAEHPTSLPSLITVAFRFEGKAVEEIQVFAASAFLDSEPRVIPAGNLPCKHQLVIQTVCGEDAPVALFQEEERASKRFLVALRKAEVRPQNLKPLKPVSPVSPALPDTDISAVVGLVLGRCLRGLIMDALASVSCTQRKQVKNTPHPFVPPVGYLSPSFAPRNVAWCLEELLLVLSPDMQKAVAKVATNSDFDEAVSLMGPWIINHDPGIPAASGNLSRAFLATHLLMGLAGRQARETERLACLKKLRGIVKTLIANLANYPGNVLVSISMQIQLEFATLLAKEACSHPALYDKEPTRSWVRSVVSEALKTPLSSPHAVTLQPIMPAAFFLTVLFADWNFKVGRETEARELLLSAVEDMDSFRTCCCPELSSVKQLLAIASHNLAVDALNRADMVGAFNNIFRLQTEGDNVPPACRQLLQWAVGLSGG